MSFSVIFMFLLYLVFPLQESSTTLSSMEGSISQSTENMAANVRARILAVRGNQCCADCNSTSGLTLTLLS